MALGELVVSIIGDMQGLSKTFSQVQTELGNVGSKISTVGQTMSSAGSAMTSGITVPLAAVSAGIGVTANAASEFDTGMRRVATMLPGITDTGFKDISNQALTLSKDFGSSTADMTDAMYQALSSGVPQDNIFSFMQEAEKLAIGGATDVVTSTDVLTTAVNSYGAANLSTAQASDILFAGTKFGKSTVEELAASLADVVPVAASLGIGFGDVNASLATMTIQGTPTAQATTQLRAIIDELGDSTSDVSAAFSEFTGQSFTEFIKGGGTVGDAVKILNSHLGETVPNMAKVQKAEKELNKPTSDMAIEFQKLSGKSFAEFTKSGGTVTQALDMMGVKYGTTANRVSEWFSRIEAGTGAQQLAGEGEKLYAQALDGTTNSLGATNEAYKTMSGGSGAALDRLKSSFEVLTIKIGDAFLPLLADTLIPAFSSLIDAIDLALPVLTAITGVFNSLPGPIKLAILGFIAFAAALGPILMIAGSIASGIGAIAALFGAGGALAGAFAFAQTAIAGIVAALGTFALPITLIIAGVALLALAWKNNWFDIQGKFEAAKASITTAATNLYNTLHLTWNGLIMAAGTLKTNLGTIWDIIVSGFNSSKTLIVNTVTGLYNSLVTGWNNIKTAISQAVTAIISVLQGWYTNLQANFTQVKAAIQALIADWSAKWNSLKTTASNLAAQIIAVLQTWYTNTQAKFTLVKQAIQQLIADWSAKWNTLKSTVSAAANQIISTLQTWYSNVQSKFNSVKTACSTFLSGWKSHWDNLVSATKTAASNIINALSSMLSNITSKFNSIVSAVSSLISAWKSKLNDLVSSTKNVGSQVVNAVSGIASDVKGLVSSFARAGDAIMDALYDSIVAGFKKAIKKAKDSLKDLKSYFPSSPAKQGPFHTLPNWDTVFVDPLSSSIDSIKALSAPLKSTLSGLKSPIDSSISSGLSSIQNVSNVNSSSSVSSGDIVINVGPVSLSNNVDIETLVTKINQISADQRRQRGVFL